MPDYFAQAFSPERWPIFVLISARVGGLMLSAPLWSMSALPGRARSALTVLLTLLLLPLAPQVAIPEQILDIPLPMVMELLVGLAIGLTAAVLVQGVALAGEVLSLQMSLSLGPVLAPMPDVQVSGLGQLKTFFALLLYVTVGGHTMLLQGLAGSLRQLPPGMPMSLDAGAIGATAVMGTVFTVAARAAGPIMVALLITNVALAILSRAVPQLNAMMVAFPITISVGLVMFGISLDLLGASIMGWMVRLPGDVQHVLDGFQVVGGAPR